MNNDELLAQVRELRASGRSPKQIARVLGLPPAKVNPLIRVVAAERARSDKLIACYVTTEWSTGLTVDGEPDWPALGAPETDASGLAGVFVARAAGHNRVSAVGFLIDVWCLGVKDAWPPKEMTASRLPEYTDRFFRSFSGRFVPAPAELARHLVFGAVDYARSLGFEPHSDFAAASELLRPWAPPSAITFGKDGKPFFISGPRDNAQKIINTLERTAGSGKYDYLAAIS
ncbi:helix-turn-helix domain-containing protein [Actinomadura sp. 7K507]|uniref:helix-turn-helix domain-containing protein n=1 Tax=Actinomadura sp. 7K507 TaxID=2530365 RepID=UPI00104483CE|nr:helix-turn-helix domain-containing protein [Actinomadura sp. 7K507]TDC85595.1 helix-turn-helix domain-containing protein [Actinomadura sp. 7K507]